MKPFARITHEALTSSTSAATSSAILDVAMAQDERNGSITEEHGAYCTSEELVSRNEVSTPMKLQLKKW
ncbi:hypothetical protein K439DRAFT_1641792 [Ramaria rubella]|nr:hypothetical protein K439DRAFT_1641792 [Ramaria rubella]